MLNFKDGRYFVAIWFISSDEYHRDWMAGLYRDFGSDQFTLVYRFRYHSGNTKPFAEDSHTNWYTAVTSSSEEKAEEGVDVLFQALALKGFGDFTDKIVFKSDDGRKNFERFEKLPWVHMRPVTPEEEKEFKAQGPN